MLLILILLILKIQISHVGIKKKQIMNLLPQRSVIAHKESSPSEISHNLSEKTRMLVGVSIIIAAAGPGDFVIGIFTAESEPKKLNKKFPKRQRPKLLHLHSNRKCNIYALIYPSIQPKKCMALAMVMSTSYMHVLLQICSLLF